MVRRGQTNMPMRKCVTMLCTSCRRIKPSVLSPAQLLLVGLLACLGAKAAGADVAMLPPPANRKIGFVTDIHPILARSCYECHGPVKAEAELHWDGNDRSIKGSQAGQGRQP